MGTEDRCRSPVIVAIDTGNAADALALAEKLDGRDCRLKVGKELFTAAGPSILRDFHALGFEVFLDLKFHDIPNTVAAAVAAAAEQGVWMVNVHASGGPTMLRAARDAVPRGKPGSPLLIAVTLLTSMTATDLRAIGIETSMLEHALLLARLAADEGLDGVVCSAHEAGAIRDSLGENFFRVTPGIRPATDSWQDQSRVMTPAQAIAAGSSWLVVGRPITAAPDPAAALHKILAEINTTL